MGSDTLYVFREVNGAEVSTFFKSPNGEHVTWREGESGTLHLFLHSEEFAMFASNEWTWVSRINPKEIKKEAISPIPTTG